LIHYLSISGVFEDPYELVDYGLYDDTGKFPIPMNLIPTLKQMIFQNDLRYLLPNPVDNSMIKDELRLEPITSSDYQNVADRRDRRFKRNWGNENIPER
jgi:hypothetical protein